MRSTLGNTKTSDINQTGLKYPCTPHPAFFPRTSRPKRIQTVWPQWLYQLWPQLWIRHSSLIGPCVQSEHYYLDWTSDLRQNKELVFVSFKKGFDKTISPATISWIKQTVILCYELSDQKAHDVRAFAASKAFQSGVSFEQNLSACHLKLHTFTQFYLKDVASSPPLPQSRSVKTGGGGGGGGGGCRYIP